MIKMDIGSLRASIPALQDSIYLNTGTFGPSPSVVLDEIRHALNSIEKHGAYSPIVRQGIEKNGRERVREKIATFLNVSSDEVSLTGSVSDGISMIAFGLDWEPGDEVVISDQEHASGMLPWMILAKRQGVKVRIASLCDDPDRILQNFDGQITPRTRLVFASHLTHRGLRMPVERLTRLVQGRGALIVLDGAHAVGQIPVSPSEIGCDAYLACGHKWLLGPQGTSMAYIPHKNLEIFLPSWSGWGAQVEEFTLAPDKPFTMKDSARRFEFGTQQWQLFPGLGAAIDFIDAVGVQAIQARVHLLAAQLKQAVLDSPQLQLMTPLASEMSAGIVSIQLPDGTPENLKEMLWERHRMLVAYAPPHRVLRLSIAFFTTEEEIAQAMRAINL